MFTTTGFIIDGVSSASLGIDDSVVLVRNSAEISMPWIGSKSIIETKAISIDVPYFHGTSKEPLAFSLMFAVSNDAYTHDTLLTLGEIFGKDNYVSFQTLDDLDKTYYVIPSGEISLITYGQYKGWFEIKFRTNAPYAWTTASTPTVSATPSLQYAITNTSNVMDSKYREIRYYPKVTIVLSGGATGMTITNVTNGSLETTLTGLTADSTVTIDNKLKLVTDSNGDNQFSKFNKVWLYLVEGENVLEFSDNATVTIYTEFPIYA